MEIITLIAIILITVVLFFLFGSNSSLKINSSAAKKEQILQNYKNELQANLQTFQTKEEKISFKKQYLQKVNSELSRNIYFSEKQAKELLKKLSVV